MDFNIVFASLLFLLASFALVLFAGLLDFIGGAVMSIFSSIIDKLGTFSGQFTCPYCMQKYQRREIEYKCPDCETVIRGEGLHKGLLKCTNVGCSGYATIARCPKCQATLPQTVLETQNLPFSIVGVTSAGKTNYITVMLDELGRFHDIPLSLSPADQTTRQLQDDNRDMIYTKHIPVESTHAGGSVTPQIWTIKNLARRTSTTVPAYSFTIFDGAGEDYETKLDPSRPECRNIKESKAIILTLDPLILRKVREIVSEDVMKLSLGGNIGQEKNSVNIVNDIASYIRNARGVSLNKLLDVPVAIVLTKFDVILNSASFPQWATSRNPSLLINELKRVNEGEFLAIDREIRDWLTTIGEASFVAALEANFKDFCFFGVSSFGSAPDSSNRIPNPKPHRVLDPVMWLFKRSNFID